MESELTHQIKDSGARHLITLDIFWPKIAALPGKPRAGGLLCNPCPRWPALSLVVAATLFGAAAGDMGFRTFRRSDGGSVEGPVRHVRRAWSVEATDAAKTIALLQYTGGTTGVAKGAMLTHANLLANLTQLMAIVQQPPEKEHVFLALLPLLFGLTITSAFRPRVWRRGWSRCPAMSPPTCWKPLKNTSSPPSSAHLPSISPCCNRRICAIRFASYRVLHFRFRTYVRGMAEKI